MMWFLFIASDASAGVPGGVMGVKIRNTQCETQGEVTLSSVSYWDSLNHFASPCAHTERERNGSILF